MKKLVDALKKLVAESGSQWSDDVERTVPRRWQKHGDLVLLSDNAFQHPVWEAIGDDVWKTVCSVLKCQHLARKARIKNDGFRSPQVEMLLGTDTWVTHIDNKIHYSFDIQRSMFSAGNISEKLRIASWDCSGETVVDLYAGIGYFTLPYLVHANAALVYACEWNPASIEALRRNLEMNRVEERCVVLPGDNAQTCPVDVADRVNLGLVPSSEAAWPTACSALKPNTGGMLHIHGNVQSFSQQTPSLTVSNTQTTELQPNSTSDQSVVLPETQLPNEAIASTSIVENSTADSSVCESSNSKKHVNPNEAKEVTDTCLVGYCGNQRVNEVVEAKTGKFAKSCKMKEEWIEWGEECRSRVEVECGLTHGGLWNASVVHIEHVKTYAPHVDHIVVDIRCTPALR